jgi:hypothetical protein
VRIAASSQGGLAMLAIVHCQPIWQRAVEPIRAIRPRN